MTIRKPDLALDALGDLGGVASPSKLLAKLMETLTHEEAIQAIQLSLDRNTLQTVGGMRMAPNPHHKSA